MRSICKKQMTLCMAIAEEMDAAVSIWENEISCRRYVLCHGNSCKIRYYYGLTEVLAQKANSFAALTFAL